MISKGYHRIQNHNGQQSTILDQSEGKIIGIEDMALK